MPPPLAVDLEKLKGQDKLTPDQEESIRQKAIDDALKAENKEPEKKPDKEPEKTPENKEKVPSLSERATKVGLAEDADEEAVKGAETELVKKEEEERILNANEEDLTEDEKAQKVEITKANEEAKGKEALEAEGSLVKDIMEGEKITEEQAKEVLAKDKGTVEKYEGNTLKIARGYRHAQSLAAKTEKELKHTQDQLQQTREYLKGQLESQKPKIEEIKKQIIEGKLIGSDKKAISEAEIIEGCKGKYPSLTKNMDDEAVVEFAAGKIIEGIEKSYELSKQERVQQASERRAELLSTLPEDAKEFQEPIKQLLDKTPDISVISPTFNLSDMIQWAKGAKYDEMKGKIAEARAEGIKIGEENAKALGEKTSTDKGGKAPVKTKKLLRELNDAEKERALNMYESATSLTEEQKFTKYIELYPEGEEGVKERLK